MRTIEWTGQFKRDYRREAKGQHRHTLDAVLFPVVELLANDIALEARHRDHGLTGDWRDHRDCHVRSDLVLIYQNPLPLPCAWSDWGLIASLVCRLGRD